MFHYRYLSLSQATIELCQTHATDVNVLKILFSSLTLISKLFYSLNFQVSSLCSALSNATIRESYNILLSRSSMQDLPEFFEDNMETWMTNFHGLLTLDNKLLQTDVSFFTPTPLLTAFSMHVFFLFSEFFRLRLLSKHSRTRRRRVFWSCSSLRSVTTPPSTPRSTTKSSSPICPNLSRPSGIF